ncbi:hypothetical protein COU19_02880 [Candidatus Kaiserbacteria bacterium CG10_big_fil_rev_8_21_14_0_10_56_12]|uniref:Uncharacterized protein n=1 Tax=Candidatus Kaiserbacteria bacterium CG10_big_fil_rev_8_21_14_0_10_56_12 TaxID=1974611 RepID=A0A2H0U991_9BACT|nr:MAG: hypothetical protein COU19_02880 [Candidatus Kaiserbacteria bacterium CG10_big_fil_rev_8_21_14_0_10_56_12]
MKNKNWPLIIGVSLPLIFIVALSVIVFLPRLFVTPAHNFIYSADTNYYTNDYYRNTYKVVQGRVTLDPIPARYTAENERRDAPALYLYDVKSDTSHQITLAEADAYTVDPGPSSPDGYVVSYEYGHNGIFELFGSDNSNQGYFISKGSSARKLTGITSGDRYTNGGGFKLIGWIQ